MFVPALLRATLIDPLPEAMVPAIPIPLYPELILRKASIDHTHVKVPPLAGEPAVEVDILALVLLGRAYTVVFHG